MNNKGQFVGGSFITLAIGIIIVLGGIAAVASTNIRFMIAGIGLIVLTLVFIVPAAIQGEFTQGKIVFLLLMIFIGAGIAFLPQTGLIQQTIFSADSVTVLGQGERLIILATPDSENAIVDLSKSELNSKLAGTGFTVDNGVRIELQLKEFAEIYTLVKQEDEIFYEIETTTLDLNIIADSKAKCLAESNINNNNYVMFYFIDDPGAFNVQDTVCVYRDPIGTRAQVSGEGFDSFSVDVIALGQTQTLTRNDQILDFGNGDIKVSFEGSLSAGQEIKQIPYDILFADSVYKYLISTTSSSYSGLSKFDGQWNSCTNGLNHLELTDATKFTNCVKDWNSDLNGALQNKNSEFAPTLVKSLNFDNVGTNKGQLKANLVAPTKLPLIKIEVDGTLVGIEKLRGIPKVDSDCGIGEIDTQSGRESELTNSIKIKNIGSQRGQFRLGGSCDNSKMNLLVPTVLNADADSTNAIMATVTGVAAKKNTTEAGICTLTIEDSQGGGSASCKFDVSIEFNDVICNPNSLYCSDDNTQILQCDEFGDSTSANKTCETGTHCGLNSDNKVACISGAPNTGPGVLDPDGKDIVIDTCTPKWYETKKVREGVDSGLFGWRKLFGNEKTFTETTCVPSPTLILIVIAGTFLILVIVLIITTKPKNKKKIKDKKPKRS